MPKRGREEGEENDTSVLKKTKVKDEGLQKNANKPQKVIIEYVKGNLLDAVPHEILVHSCNCLGSWGKGIALSLKENYPDHFKRYQVYCKTHKADELIGKCLLLGPSQDGKSKGIWIGCLFTRKTLMKMKGQPSSNVINEVVRATTSSMKDLYDQMQRHRIDSPIAMPKINSGLFRTPWERTESALSSVIVPKEVSNVVKVYSL